MNFTYYKLLKVSCLITAGILTCNLAACTSTPQGTVDVLAADRANGTVQIGYVGKGSEFSPIADDYFGENADWESALGKANNVCKNWGYKGATKLSALITRKALSYNDDGDIKTATFYRSYQCVVPTEKTLSLPIL